MDALRRGAYILAAAVAVGQSLVACHDLPRRAEVETELHGCCLLAGEKEQSPRHAKDHWKLADLRQNAGCRSYNSQGSPAARPLLFEDGDKPFGPLRNGCRLSEHQER